MSDITTVSTVASGNFLIPDATFLAELVAFVLILAFMWRYVVPPLQKNMETRQGVIRQQLEDSRLAAERLAAAEAQYQKMVGEARAEAARTRMEGNKIRQEIIDSAKEEARIEAEAVTSRAEARLDVERRQVLAELRGEIGRLAVELAERIVGESLADDERQSRVVDRFLADLDNAPAAAGAGEAR